MEGEDALPDEAWVEGEALPDEALVVERETLTKLWTEEKRCLGYGKKRGVA